MHHEADAIGKKRKIAIIEVLLIHFGYLPFTMEVVEKGSIMGQTSDVLSF